MATQPTHNISSKSATDLLKDGQPLIDSYIEGEIKIEVGGDWNKEVIIENCFIEYFSGSATHFEKPVKLFNSHFKKCQFVFSYFVGGLTIDNCTFDTYLDFQAGGHNKPANQIIIVNNNFANFVNFFDCWFNGHVTITDNKFYRGTNIESKKQLITFDFSPVIENNLGDIKVEGELAEDEP